MMEAMRRSLATVLVGVPLLAVGCSVFPETIDDKPREDAGASGGGAGAAGSSAGGGGESATAGTGGGGTSGAGGSGGSAGQSGSGGGGASGGAAGASGSGATGGSSGASGSAGQAGSSGAAGSAGAGGMAGASGSSGSGGQAGGDGGAPVGCLPSNNLIVNPSFELLQPGPGGQPASWTVVETDGFGGQVSTTPAHHTTGIRALIASSNSVVVQVGGSYSLNVRSAKVQDRRRQGALREPRRVRRERALPPSANGRPDLLRQHRCAHGGRGHHTLSDSPPTSGFAPYATSPSASVPTGAVFAELEFRQSQGLVVIADSVCARAAD